MALLNDVDRHDAYSAALRAAVQRNESGRDDAGGTAIGGAVTRVLDMCGHWSLTSMMAAAGGGGGAVSVDALVLSDAAAAITDGGEGDPEEREEENTQNVLTMGTMDARHPTSCLRELVRGMRQTGVGRDVDGDSKDDTHECRGGVRVVVGTVDDIIRRHHIQPRAKESKEGIEEDGVGVRTEGEGTVTTTTTTTTTDDDDLEGGCHSHGYDVIVSDVIEGSGLVRQGILEELRLARRFLLKHPGGEVVPRRMRVFARCVESSFIAGQNCVFPDRVVGLNLSQLDTYRVTSFRDLALDTLPHLALSADFAVGHVPLDEEEDGDDADARHCTVDVAVTASGRLDAIVYWFALDMGNVGSIGGADTGGTTSTCSRGGSTNTSMNSTNTQSSGNTDARSDDHDTGTRTPGKSLTPRSTRPLTLWTGPPCAPPTRADVPGDQSPNTISRRGLHWRQAAFLPPSRPRVVSGSSVRLRFQIDDCGGVWFDVLTPSGGGKGVGEGKDGGAGEGGKGGVGT